MLIWMCALSCEAKPVIDWYRLQKSTPHHEFTLYQNSRICCVVSGIGGVNMASATEWAGRQFKAQDSRCWINLGIAGHKDMPTGTAVLADKISSNDANTTFMLKDTVPHPFQRAQVASYSTEQSHYPELSVCDMEAFHFLTAAMQFDPIESCTSIKVISDNEKNPAHRNKAEISALIAEHMKAISQYADRLHHLSGAR